MSSPLCLICGSTGGGCDGALETVDSVMQESSKIADKIFNFLGTHGGGGGGKSGGGGGADGGKCTEEYRGKKICRRCLIAATELSDMEDSTDTESRFVLHVLKTLCQNYNSQNHYCRAIKVITNH